MSGGSQKGSLIHVLAGVIYTAEAQRILIARRPQHLHQGGLWEFPGGKKEPGESPRQALLRELEEELAIAVRDCAPLLRVDHDYGDKRILLDTWQVTEFSGEAIGNEGQEIRWVPVSALADYAFPAANQPIVERLLRLHAGTRKVPPTHPAKTQAS